MTALRGLGSLINAMAGEYTEQTDQIMLAARGKIVEIRVEPGESTLAIVTDDGPAYLDTEGDCCSESWWADAVGVSLAIGHRITATEMIDLPEPTDGRSRQDSDVAYGVRVTTTGGVLDLVYRNSSNGYYGGRHTVTTAERDTSSWRSLTEDWSAA